MPVSTILPAELLQQQGVVDWGYTEQASAETFPYFQQWLDQKFHGPLSYLDGERGQQRQDLKLFFPAFQGAIVFLFGYGEQTLGWQKFYQEDPSSNQLKIASYALAFAGKDYHQLLGDRLQQLAAPVLAQFPALKIMLALDIHPVLERDLAWRCGLGWFGKNTMLISPQHGSFVMIGTLLLSAKIPPLNNHPRPPVLDHCGNCRACIDRCPTAALSDHDPRQLAASKCLSTFTIETFRPAAAPAGIEKGSGEIFGCDLCQDVCPWNKKALAKLAVPAAPAALAVQLSPIQQDLAAFFLQRPASTIISDLAQMSNRQYQRQFAQTALARPTRAGMLKNIQAQVPYLPSSSTQTC